MSIDKHGSLLKGKNEGFEPLGFDKFFFLVNGWVKIKIAAVIALFISIPLYRSYSKSTTPIAVLLVCIVLVIFLIVTYLYLSAYYKAYIRFVQLGEHAVLEWNSAVRSLSPDFWRGKTFASIKIEMKVASTALPGEQKLLLDFGNRFSIEGNKILSHVAMDGLRLELRFDQGKQSAFVMRKLFNDLPEVIKKIRNGQVALLLHFDGEATKPSTTRGK